MPSGQKSKAPPSLRFAVSSHFTVASRSPFTPSTMSPEPGRRRYDGELPADPVPLHHVAEGVEEGVRHDVEERPAVVGARLLGVHVLHVVAVHVHEGAGVVDEERDGYGHGASAADGTPSPPAASTTWRRAAPRGSALA